MRLRVLKSSSRGFTLMEILAVMVLIGLIIGAAAPMISRQITKGKMSSTKIQLSGIKQSLTSFNLDCGFYPSTAAGLQALIEPPTTGKKCKDFDPAGYFDKSDIPLDPWKEEFIYVYPGQNNRGSFDLVSKGPDLTEGTEDDITNW